MRNAGLDDSQTGIKISGRNISSWSSGIHTPNCLFLHSPGAPPARTAIEVNTPTGQTQTPHPVLDPNQGAGNQHMAQAQEVNNLSPKFWFYH